jgi:hypothetical protein
MKLIILTVGSLLLLSSGIPQEPQYLTPLPERCVAEKISNAPEYRIARVMLTGTRPPEKYLLVSVQPEDFTQEKMTALARQFSNEFCKEARFGVMIFDDYKAARFVTYMSPTRELEKAERGFYHVDRKRHEEFIHYSTARGKPRDEIKINLSKE